MKYVHFLRGNYANFRYINGLTQQLDVCEYKDRHAWLWYNPYDLSKTHVAIEFIDKNRGIVCDIIQLDSIKPQIWFSQIEPPVCGIENIEEIQIQKVVLEIVQFIYKMDNDRFKDIPS